MHWFRKLAATGRDGLLRLAVAWGVAVWAITEVLSSVHLLNRPALVIAWVIVVLVLWGRWAACTPIARRLPAAAQDSILPHSYRLSDPIVCLSIAGIAAILFLTALTAIVSPPNSADAMAYHMPRVVYWAGQSSVRFFPTPYLNQIMLQPMAEYVMLHTYLLSGGDRFINLVAWFASLMSIIAVSAIAREYGAGLKGQAIAALFCATLPAGILACSGAKNDYLMALWLACAVYFAKRLTATAARSDTLWLGCALGLALLTKATAYLFAPWPIVFILLQSPKRRLRGAAVALLCALAINAPLYVRNFHLSGSPLGFDSAQANGYYRWRNETFGWKQTASNLLRNTAEQLGARSPRWNQAVFDFALAAHRTLGIDPRDPADTWRGAAFAPPVNANHEANAPNRWHLAILCIAALWCLFRARSRAWYALALVCGFVAFCAFLKWQPFMARLILPLFVLGAPVAAIVEEIRPLWLQAVLCVFLLNNARPAALENWVRPLQGPHSILHRDRNEMYFADMGQWNNAASYPAAVRALRQSGCNAVGIDINNFQLEYPLQALLRQVNPRALFFHVAVANSSQKYAPPAFARACAIVCLDCLGDDRRLALYRDYPKQVTAGKFVVLTR
ncbi:MAG TPA: glycosyltransferase family 39 protein [Bryobacteraceae bacterium]|nr:glycosyltransferase family 39 protein [Bryobacteraceae bacterium]